VTPDKAGDPGGERRRVTVVFCDLVGSTRLSDSLDPEDYSDVMHAYYDSCSRVIEGLGGWIADYLGDGLVVYFGYPTPHEDDPMRAVRAGLGLISSVSELGAQLAAQTELSCRVGIETGLVVIGEAAGEKREPIWALGRTVNLAARLQSIAPDGSVVIGEGTRSLVEGWFNFEPLGDHSFKGISKPIAVAKVVSETGARDRLRAAMPFGLPALIDRESEQSRLQDAWTRAQAGRGGVILLRGEAGIGKSRIALSLLERARELGARVADLHCTLEDVVSPLAPVVDYLQREAGLDPADEPERRVARVHEHVSAKALSDPDASVLLAEVLVPEARPPTLDTSAEERRYRAMRVLADTMLSSGEPEIIAVEDLHWADPSTIELLGMIAERIEEKSVLLLLTARPEFETPWPGDPPVGVLEVGHFDATFTAALASSVAGAHLPREVHALIHARSEGVPLFVEELTRSVLESGLVTIEEGGAVIHGRLEETVPGTVYDLLVARIGRLGPDAGVAQLAAVLGQEFSADFLRAVAPEERELDTKLGRLIEAGIVQRRGDGGTETFWFSHALVRDAAYGLLLRKRRRELHGRVADVLLRDYPDLVEARPELAAPHFTESGRDQEAIEYWLKAGGRAVAQYALHEAIDHYQRALELVRALPGSPERVRREIEILFSLGPLIQNASGGGDPRLRELHARVSELSHWLTGDAERFTFLAYGYATQMVLADYQAARQTAALLVDVTEAGRSKSRALVAHCFYGTTLFQLGEIEASRASVERCIELYDPDRHEALINVAAIDPGVVAWGYRAWTEWHLGRADTARRTAAELLDLVAAHPHPFRTATALVWVAGLAYRMRDPEDVARHAGAAIAISAERGYEELERYATCLRGWAIAVAGDAVEGAETIRRGLALVPHGGSRAHTSWHLMMLAEAERSAGRPLEALDAVSRGQTFVEETGERVFLPELIRLGAELRNELGVSSKEETLSMLSRAVEIAREQPSLPFELRAATAFYRIRDDAASRRVLQECVDSLPEGAGTAEVREARALLRA
jgi:class 3 adenylate cyclase/tetratricopeptide (TPR) repeat protein